MKTTLCLAFSFALVSCVGREAQGRPARPSTPLTLEETLAAFDQSVGGPSDNPREGDVVEAHPSLFEAVAQEDCERESPDCELTVKHRLLVKGDIAPPANWPRMERIEEVALVGLDLERRCEWSLVARSGSGWLDPIELGTSADGCRTPLDDGAIENSGGLWFPLAFSADGLALRIEAQTFEPSEELVQVWDEPTTRVTVSRRREVLLCQVHPFGHGGLACASESEPSRPLSGNLETLFAAAPIAAGAKLLPLSAASQVGTLEAKWVLAPLIESTAPSPLTEVFSRYRLARVELHALEPNGPTVLVERLEPAILLVGRGHVHWVGSHLTSYENESLSITRTEARPGVVRVDFERVVDGPTRVTWRFTELVTATRHIRLATGVEIAVDGQPVRAWSREVSADRDGVTLSAGSGELAWFRGTGRFTWSELERATVRWRVGFARAWTAVADEPRRFSDKDESELRIKETVGRLVTLPGYAEPTDWVVLDVVRRLPR